MELLGLVPANTRAKLNQPGSWGPHTHAADQRKVTGGTNGLTADGANVGMRLGALSLSFCFRGNAREANLQVNASVSEFGLEGLSGRGMRVAVGPVIIDLQIACLTFNSESLVMVTTILAGIFNLI